MIAIRKLLAHYLQQESLKLDNIFELLNFEYLGPIDGHNMSSLLPEDTLIESSSSLLRNRIFSKS